MHSDVPLPHSEHSIPQLSSTH